MSTSTLETKTDAMDTAREKFLAERKTGIGGSDAACIVGLNPYKPALQLYLEKRGEIDEADLSDNAAVRWGTILEDVVADHFAESTGKKVRENKELLRSEKWPHMIAHLDRELVDEDAILECKTAGAFASKDEWGEAYTDQVPEHYLLQCQHYLAVTERAKCYLAVLIGGRDFRVYVLNRDEDLIEALAEEEGKFWQACIDGVEPVADYEHQSALDLMKRRYNRVATDIVQFAPEAVAAHERLVKAKDLAKQAKSEEDAAKAEILAAMGNSEYALLPDGTGYKRIQITIEPHEVKGSKYVRLNFTKKVSL